MNQKLDVSTAATPSACTLPPEGWICKRHEGHVGPCACVPLAEGSIISNDNGLRPCPFCGGEASVIGIRDGRQVSCKGQPRKPCFAKGPAVYHSSDWWGATEEKAIAAWNVRL